VRRGEQSTGGGRDDFSVVNQTYYKLRFIFTIIESFEGREERDRSTCGESGTFLRNMAEAEAGKGEVHRRKLRRPRIRFTRGRDLNERRRGADKKKGSGRSRRSSRRDHGLKGRDRKVKGRTK